MTHMPPSAHVPAPSEAGRQIAQLRHVLGLVEQIAARGPVASNDEGLEEGARISGAYALASPIVQRRFDARAEETIAWAAAGVGALLDAQEASEAPRAAAAALADQLADALQSLGRMVRS